MYALNLKGLVEGFDGCVDCGEFRGIWRALRGARRGSGARTGPGGIKRKGRAGPGGWTQISTRQSIVHSEGLVKIIMYWEAGFSGGKRGKKKRDSSHERRAMQNRTSLRGLRSE